VTHIVPWHFEHCKGLSHSILQTEQRRGMVQTRTRDRVCLIRLESILSSSASILGLSVFNGGTVGWWARWLLVRPCIFGLCRSDSRFQRVAIGRVKARKIIFVYGHRLRRLVFGSRTFKDVNKDSTPAFSNGNVEPGLISL
jgi:hypothetical protein